MLQDQTAETSASPFLQALSLFGERPEVIGVDIGILPIAHGDCPVGLRIHVATPADVVRVHNSQRVPNDINGVRLMLVPTQYKTVAAHRTKKQTSSMVKYFILSDGLGQLLSRIMAKQHPLAGRNHQLIANSAANSQVIAPCVADAGRDILKTLEELEESIKCTPDAPAPILCYQIGQLIDSGAIELNISNLSQAETKAKHPRRYRVDGCGLYKHDTDRGQRFVEGFRILPV